MPKELNTRQLHVQGARFALTVGVVLFTTLPASAQLSNATYSLHHETVVSSGGRVAVTGGMRATTSLGLPAAGTASNASFRVRGGVVSGLAMLPPPTTLTITVTGTTNDPAAIITVNGIPATVSTTTYAASGIVLVLGHNTLTITAKDAVGNIATRTSQVYLDLPASKKTPRFSIHVRGAVNDTTASVKVNGTQATLTSGNYDVLTPVTGGYNTITTIATDTAGNQASRSIRVFVPEPTQPPAMPTVGTVGTLPPLYTIDATATVGGTKTAGTTIWINGQQIAADPAATTWSATLPLVEGDNWFSVVAKDAAGVSSAAAKLNVVRDNNPPVITIPATLKTNFNPYALTGTVDDSLTQVKVGTVDGTNTLGAFSATTPLVLGQNTLLITATSPRGLVATKTVTVTLGTIPTIQSVQPLDGAKTPAGSAVTFAITSTDLEGDPQEYRVLLDGSPLGAWSSTTPSPWAPGSGQTGAHTLTASVRDGFGGEATQDVEVYVIRPTIDHP